MWSHHIFAWSAITPVVALVSPGVQTSSFTLGEVTPTLAGTWLLCHLHVGVGETLLLLLPLLSKVWATGMLNRRFNKGRIHMP